MGRPALDLTNQRFGLLTAVRNTGYRDSKKYVIWECVCDCGVTTFVSTKHLRTGEVKSCGCLQKQLAAELALEMAKNNQRNYLEGTYIKNLSSKAPKNNTSGRRGVSWSARDQKWEAYIKFRRKRYCLGYFDEFDKAVQAREEAEEKYFAPVLEEYGGKNR